jgi:hypothetical protein
MPIRSASHTPHRAAAHPGTRRQTRRSASRAQAKTFRFVKAAPLSGARHSLQLRLRTSELQFRFFDALPHERCILARLRTRNIRIPSAVPSFIARLRRPATDKGLPNGRARVSERSIGLGSSSPQPHRRRAVGCATDRSPSKRNWTPSQSRNRERRITCPVQ